MKFQLNEDSRTQLISRSKSGKSYALSNQHKGRNRYQRRVHSSIANSVKEFNAINMNKLFKQNILDVWIKVHGETNDYTVKISFGGFLDSLRKQLNGNDNIQLRDIIRSLLNCFNSDNVYIGCTCPDFKYRMGYYALKQNVSSYTGYDWKSTGNNLVVTKAPDITNPNNDLGAGCKHICLVLSNTSWLIKVASVINNYIKYVKTHYETQYAEIIFPAIFEKSYDDFYQRTLFDTDTLSDDTEEINKSNEEGRVRGRFKPTNKEQEETEEPVEEEDENQINLFDLEQ